MHFNRYQERVIETGLKKSAKLVLPESSDPRVSLAKRQLIDLGYELLEPQDFQDSKDQYRKKLEQKHFFSKLSDVCLTFEDLSSVYRFPSFLLLF